MIYKRYLLNIWENTSQVEEDNTKSGPKQVLGMGEDEQQEVIIRSGLNPRTWWRKWFKVS